MVVRPQQQVRAAKQKGSTQMHPVQREGRRCQTLHGKLDRVEFFRIDNHANRKVGGLLHLFWLSRAGLCGDRKSSLEYASSMSMQSMITCATLVRSTCHMNNA